MAAGLAVVGLENGEVGKKQKQSVMEKHKSLLSKVNGLNNKLTKAILHAESSLPSLKRTVSPIEYSAFRSGLDMCRAARVEHMDRVEDLKTLADRCDIQEEQLEALQQVLKDAGEHLDALLESKKKLQPTPPLPSIKNEAEKPNAGDGGHEEEGHPDANIDGNAT